MCPCVVCVPEAEVREEDRSGVVGAARDVLMVGDMLCVACAKRVQGAGLSRLSKVRVGRTITRYQVRVGWMPLWYRTNNA